MNDSILNYISNLQHAMNNIEATTRTNEFLNFNQAVKYAMELVMERVSMDSKIIFVGNGASASISSHQAVDYWKRGGFRAISFNDCALLTCMGNDFGYSEVFAKPVEMFADPGDLLVAISSSGMSENVLNAVKIAHSKYCDVITLSGLSPQNPLRQMGELNFYVPSELYGHVEVTHLTILHCVVDLIVEARNKTAISRGQHFMVPSEEQMQLA